MLLSLLAPLAIFTALLTFVAITAVLLEFFPGLAVGQRPAWWILKRTTLAPAPVRVRRPAFRRR